MKYAIIYSADYDSQVLQILPVTTMGDVWDLANELFSESPYIEHYDVVRFDSLREANHWILDQVQESRLTKQ